MLTTTVIFAFSLLIVGSHAECPPNPKEKALECGAIFTEFGKDAQLQRCPEVYEALDCLRDIFNDCEMYQKLGLSMSDEEYSQIKKPLDNVCNTRPPMVVNKDEVNKVLVQIGSVSYRVIFYADFLSPDSGASDEIPDQNATSSVEADDFSNLNTSSSVEVDEFPDQNTTSTEALSDLNSLDAEQSDVAPSPECSLKLMACNQNGQGMSPGQDVSFTEMCSKMSDMADCMDEIANGECGSSLPPQVTGNLRMAREQYNRICSGQLPSGFGQNKKRDESDMQDRSPECYMKLMACNQHGQGMAPGQDVSFTEMCSKMSDMADCMDEIANGECGSSLPLQVTGNLGMARQQYNGICSGQLPSGFGQNKKRDESDMQDRSPECYMKLMACNQHGQGMAPGQDVSFTEMCSKMSDMADCMDEITNGECGSSLPPQVTGNLGMARQQYNGICFGQLPSGFGQNKKRDVSDVQGTLCMLEAETCADILSSFLLARDVCGTVRGYLKCYEGLGKCHSLLPSLFTNQYQTAKSKYDKVCTGNKCADDTQHCYSLQLNFNHDEPASTRCPRAYELVDCALQLPECGSPDEIFFGDFMYKVNSMVRRCEYENWSPLTKKRNVPGLSPDEKRCSNLASECSKLVLQLSPTEHVCVGMAGFIRCMETVTEQCEEFAPEGVSLADHFSTAKSEYQRMCGHDYSARETRDLESECQDMSQECVAVASRLQYSSDLSVLCGELIEITGCSENLIEHCASILPNITQLRGKLAKSKLQVQSLCSRYLPVGTVSSSTNIRAECTNLLQNCMSQYSTIDYNLGMGHTCSKLGVIVGCFKNVIRKCRTVLPNAAQIESNINTSQSQISNVCMKRSVSKRSMETFECVIYFGKCERLYGQKPFTKVHEITDCSDLDANIRCNADGVELCRHILPDYDGAMQKITDARELYNSRCMKRSVSKRSMETFECVIYFGKCERLYGQKPFTKVHEITDCSDLDANIRCNADGVELCRHILPDYDGAMQKITDARELYNSRCMKRSVSKRSMETFECVIYFGKCERLYGQKPFTKVHEITDCSDLDANIRCNADGVELCRHILPDYDGAMQKITDARVLYNSRCGQNTSEVEERGTRETASECQAMTQECVAMVGRFQYSSDLSVLCGDLREMVGCMENVVGHCSSILPNIFTLRSQLARSKSQVGRLCAMELPGGILPTPTGKQAECTSLLQSCMGHFSSINYNDGLESTCSKLRTIVGCLRNVLDECRTILPNAAQTERSMMRAQQQVSNTCGSVSERGTRETASECQAMSQECVAMVGRFQYSSDLSVLCGDLREMVGCMENVVERCSSILPNIFTLRNQLARSKSQVGKLCAMELPGGTLPPPTAIQAECTSLLQSCMGHFSSINYNDGLESTCSKLRTIVGCLRNVLKKCRTVLPNAAQTERSMMRAQQQVSNTCGSVSGSGSNMVTSSPSSGGATLSECSTMTSKCMGALTSLMGDQNPESICRIVKSTVECFDEVIDKCSNVLPNIGEIETQMVAARQQVGQACSRPSTKAGPPGIYQECNQMAQECLKMLPNLSVSPDKEQTCRGFQKIKSCLETAVKNCGADQAQVEGQMTGLEQQIAQICGSMDFGPETAVKSKPVEGGMQDMNCHRDLQRCSTEFDIESQSDADCDDMLAAFECYRNVTDACRGVFPLKVIFQVDSLEEKVKQCNFTTEETEEVDDAWCASQAQTCLDMISSFSVKNGMEATCSSLQNMVKCFDDVMDKCQSAIADLQKNSGQLMAMKEKITSGCRKGGTGLVITPNSNQEKCMNKYKRCAGLMANVPLHEDNTVMCPQLRRSMACIKKVTLECGSLLPESTKQQFSNFENLNKICPVGSYKAGKRGKFTEKCKNDIKVCDNKVSEIMNGGDDIEKKDCRVGFRILTCYRQVAKECRLPKSNRKFFKQFKSLLTDTCERRSTVKHTRGLIDFDIDWPDLELDGDWEGDDSSEDGVLFGDD